MVSLGFVFAAITELAVLLCIKQHKCSKDRPVSTNKCYELNEQNVTEKENDNVQEILKAKMISQRNQDTESMHRRKLNNRFYDLPVYTRIDCCVLILFNLSYAIFNLIYWAN